MTLIGGNGASTTSLARFGKDAIARSRSAVATAPSETGTSTDPWTRSASQIRSRAFEKRSPPSSRKTSAGSNWATSNDPIHTAPPNDPLSGTGLGNGNAGESNWVLNAHSPMAPQRHAVVSRPPSDGQSQQTGTWRHDDWCAPRPDWVAVPLVTSPCLHLVGSRVLPGGTHTTGAERSPRDRRCEFFGWVGESPGGDQLSGRRGP